MSSDVLQLESDEPSKVNKTKFDGRSDNGKDEWLTPPYILKALGEFDLDPCAPVVRPWSTAKNHFTIFDNGLLKQWKGRVFCNPPYGDNIKAWMLRMKEHNNGIALTFARTETEMFFQCVWGVATAILWIEKRVTFYHVSGKKGDYSGGGTKCLNCLRRKQRGGFKEMRNRWQNN